jgi:hypothetical protein
MEVTETSDFSCNGIVINDIFEGYRDVAVLMHPCITECLSWFTNSQSGMYERNGLSVWV